MSVVVRGAKNAFRNGLRTAAVVLILAISIGLSLSMLVANKAVEGRIADLKKQVDRTILVNPAGSRGMEGGGEPLTNDDLAKVKQATHVESASAFLNVMLQTQTEGDENSNFMIKMRGVNGKEPGKTNLESSIDAGTLGKRFNATSDDENMPAPKLPIRGLATNGVYDASGKRFNLTDGRLLTDADNNSYNAVVGKNLAEKNSLKVGSTFTAYDKTFTVVGIVDQGTEFENDLIIFPLGTMQTLTELNNEISAIVARADSIETLETAVSNIKNALGEDKADVTVTQQNIQDAITSLKSVQNISIIGFVTALAAAALIVLMVMFVIVRERKREIGVLKAIGGSNRSIVSQFVVEAVVLVAIGGVLGLGTAFLSSGAIANALVSNNVQSSESTETDDSGPIAGGGKQVVQIGGSGKNLQENTSELVGEVTTSIGASTLLYGFLGMLAIAVAGSAIPAWLIAKVRPAEVLRGE